MPILRPGETIILQASKRNIIEKWGQGTLYLTNFRLVLEGTTGLISKKLRVAFDIRLDNITNIAIIGMLRKRLAVLTSERQYDLNVDDISLWEGAIRTEISQFKPPELVSLDSITNLEQNKLEKRHVACPSCGESMIFIPQIQKYFCKRCNKILEF